MAAIQYTGIKNVIKAIENIDIPYFAVFSGKALVYKNPAFGESGFDNTADAANSLQEFLESLNQGSNAIYTLKLYETIPAGGINDKTPANYSINFRLNLEGMDKMSQTISAENRNNTNSEILSELKALRMRVDEMQSEEPEDKPGGILGALLNNEAVLNMLVASVAGLGAHFLEKLKINPINKPVTTMAGIDEQIIEPTENEKIKKAIEVLSASDKNLGNHLLILAKMSIDNPAQFHMLLGMLK
jgi:hypothetical protein